MSDLNKKEHWETIYKTKDLKNVSWYQDTPKVSLDFITYFHLPKTAKIIDVGGGDSLLVDHLLDLGYEDITVLDISEAAIAKAKKRLGRRAEKVKWINANIAHFVPDEKYDLWHDRATFHFLTDKNEINHYKNAIREGIAPGAALVIGTFSESGPEKCSGIPITRYSKESLNEQFKDHFKKVKCTYTDHKTPFNTTQNFIFCGFKK
ncbi:class I SAM-dependent methyltransferase [Aquimarina celericrescens]|uniref:Class I SAM-dependent methyltransferase n=1 Tax=Aquimarina celericrescens TaxID=1964542 RepID=A0ABW5AYD2_9FLAO|nr:class I SAM-dependent methyltransferase [Aquimarina celericrescens]